MTTDEIIDILREKIYLSETEGESISPSICQEVMNKLAELQRFIDNMLGDHYVDYLEWYMERCRYLEDELEIYKTNCK